MRTFYLLSKTAEFFHSGSSGFCKMNNNFKNLELYEKINKEYLPKVFKRIIEILSP
jgi:hypothetical protein